MRRIVVPWLVLIACRGEEPPPPAPGTASGSADIDLCALASRALDGAKCARVADAESAARTKQQIDALLGPAGRGGSFGSPELQTACARMLVALDRDRERLECTLALTLEERALVKARAGDVGVASPTK